ncbi:TIR-only protein [Gossypium hirsutum]|uniref:TIR-only protein n=1 Tax=Gossypium hirsutum TaxID=3635 RepID=A0A1U8KP40_GOSHI|nr:TIR-only protein-like [Gossypium hirsutum]
MHRQRYSSAVIKNFLARQTTTKNLLATNDAVTKNKAYCDVFINHRGIDTKRTLATLLYDHLSRQKLKPFLDNKNMKPGDKLFDHIDNAIRNCQVGIAVFSPNYCKSYFCLHELALFAESKKKVIPIFCDVKPSQLSVTDNGNVPKKDLLRFESALEEAKCTVGLTFDSLEGNWLDVVNSTSEIVMKSLIEMKILVLVLFRLRYIDRLEFSPALGLALLLSYSGIGTGLTIGSDNGRSLWYEWKFSALGRL